jgi:serine/threonine protein kinase/AAA+ superfamily predicted ATPase
MNTTRYPNGGRLGDFELTAELGRGAFKTVYRASNTAAVTNGFPETVAVCVPHCQDEEGRKIMENEFRVASALEHPAIVRQFLVAEDAGILYAVMERVEGETIAERLKRTGAFPIEAAVEIVRQVGEALDYAHDGMAIHRDIKPGNIMLVSRSHAASPPAPSTTEDSASASSPLTLHPPPSADRLAVKVLDFGLARLMAHSQYVAATRVGTVAYMAPEQFEGGTGFNADLWALGATFFQMITNTLPFLARDEGSMMHRILYEPPNLDAVTDAGFDRRLANVLRKVFEKDPDKRYRRAADFAADLEAVLRHATAVNHVEAEIEVLIKSHYPLLMIQSHEEERVLRALRRVRDSLATERPDSDMELFVWSQTRGVRDRSGRPVLSGSTGDPVQALEFAVRGTQAGIHVFLDIHRHLTPVTVRQIRDAIWMVKRKRKSLIFTGPVLNVPDELRADATLLTFDTPDMNDLRGLIDAVAEEIGQAETPDGDAREKLARAVIGVTRREAERVLTRAALRRGGLGEACVADAVAEKRQIVRKEGILEFRDPDVSFADVGGLDLLKGWFSGRRRAFAEAGRRFGLPAPRGVVLAGVPGCGKSLSAKALAADWGVPLLRLDMGRVYASLVGEAESNLRRALRTAELTSPCVLWIDELEKAFSGLGNARDSGVTQRLFGCFLTWLEDRRGPVFVVATANDITGLPPEFTRKGRFDEVFFVDLPASDERRAIFDVQLRAFATAANGCEPDAFDLDALAQAADEFSGAEIREMVVGALYEAFDTGPRPVRQADLLAEIRGANPLARSRARDIADLRAWAGVNARPAQAAGTGR